MEKIKDNYYFKAFVRLSDYSLKAAEYLNEIVTNFDYMKLAVYKSDIHQIEHDADQERHQVIANLFKEFITPIEREDILAILSAIDDVTDMIEDVVMRMFMFNIQELRTEMALISKIILDCTISLKSLLEEFCHYKKSTRLKELISVVLELEEDCDTVYSEAVRRLFMYETDPVKLFIWEDLFYRLENCCDACGYVSKEVEAALFKNL
ncbi:MAG: DUF47 family protein [Candidatus Izemoplasmatales bacterium]|nr:DUF47 family protein [Candidatus Izemoplasmatales bacterium]